MPGIVVSFDAERGTAAIQPANSRLPVLPDVPVYLPEDREIPPGALALVVFADFDTEFGVRYEPLRRIAPTPVLPDFKEEETVSGSVVEMFDMKVKNIETDGEMSAYATAGHDGVLIVDADHFGDAISRGLLPGDVIGAVGETRVDHTEDLAVFSAAELNGNSITVLRAQGRTVLPPQ
jgi:hypothetical protein